MRVGSLAGAEAKVLVGASVTSELPATPPSTETPETTLTVDLIEEDDEDAGRGDWTMPRWPIPAVVAISGALVIAMFGFGLLDGDDSTTAAPASTTTPSTTVAPSTTVPTTTAPPPTTTVPPTTTLPGTGSLVAAGEPVPVPRLELHADGVGPIAVGTAAPEAIGRFVASLGEPEEIGVAGPGFGLCEGDTGRFVRWAGLSVIVSGTLENGTFVAYRFQEPEVPVSHLDLATPSGIHLGDTIEMLNEVYASYDISYATDATGSTFTLSDGDELLLWGPVSSTESTGQVEGIFSPPPCPAD